MTDITITPPVVFSQNWFYLASNAPTVISKTSKCLYEIACGVFRLLAMSLQYFDVMFAITIYRWCWFSSAIQGKNLTVASRNIVVDIHLLQKCLKTAWSPLAKNIFTPIGLAQGLRITHDIIYRPACGLCLGMSLVFLSNYLSANEVDCSAKLLFAAKVLESGGNEICVKLQAIYEALMGIQGNIKIQEINSFWRLLNGENVNPQDIENEQLFDSIHAFIKNKNCPEILRDYLFAHLESKRVEITPDIYALILELDSLWYSQNNSESRKNDFVHNAITQAVANCLELEIELKSVVRVEGEVSCVVNELKKLVCGSYLVQFSNHTIALVKTQKDDIAFFDPNEGMAFLDTYDRQKEALLHLLRYYSRNDLVAIKVIPIQLKKVMEIYE